MKQILNKYNNFHDTVVKKVLLSYDNTQQNTLNIILDIECYDTMVNSWRLARFVFKEVNEFAIISNQVISEANLIQEDDNIFVDFYFGDKTSLKRIRNESRFYICFKEVEEEELMSQKGEKFRT